MVEKLKLKGNTDREDQADQMIDKICEILERYDALKKSGQVNKCRMRYEGEGKGDKPSRMSRTVYTSCPGGTYDDNSVSNGMGHC